MVLKNLEHRILAFWCSKNFFWNHFSAKRLKEIWKSVRLTQTDHVSIMSPRTAVAIELLKMGTEPNCLRCCNCNR